MTSVYVVLGAEMRYTDMYLVWIVVLILVGNLMVDNVAIGKIGVVCSVY